MNRVSSIALAVLLKLIALIKNTALVYLGYEAIVNEPVLFNIKIHTFKESMLNNVINRVFSRIPKYRPTFWLPGPLIKFWFNFWRTKKQKKGVNREVLKLADGAEIGLDYFPREQADKPVGDGEPLVVLVPGMGFEADFVNCDKFGEKLWTEYRIRSVVLKRRGYEGLACSSESTAMSWLRVEDLDEVIDYLKQAKRTRACRLFLAGFNFGAHFCHVYSIVQSALEPKRRRKVEGVISVSAPDLSKLERDVFGKEYIKSKKSVMERTKVRSLDKEITKRLRTAFLKAYEKEKNFKKRCSEAEIDISKCIRCFACLRDRKLKKGGSIGSRSNY